MRVSDERLAGLIEAVDKNLTAMWQTYDLILDLRDERALCDKLAEALRIARKMLDTSAYSFNEATFKDMTNTQTDAAVRDAKLRADDTLAAYDKERER